MSRLADYLDPIIRYSPERDSKAAALMIGPLAELASGLSYFAGTSPGAAWLVSLMQSRHHGQPVHPLTALEILSAFGVGPDTTLDELDAIARNIPVRPDRWAQLFERRLNVDYDSLRDIENDALRSLVLSELECASDILILSRDVRFKVLTHSVLADILAASPAHHYPWIEQRRDCDDHCRIFRGWLSELGYGNLAMAEAEMVMFDGADNAIGLHAILLAAVYNSVSGKTDILIIEPADGKIKYRDYAISGGVRNLFIRVIW